MMSSVDEWIMIRRVSLFSTSKKSTLSALRNCFLRWQVACLPSSPPTA